MKNTICIKGSSEREFRELKKTGLSETQIIKRALKVYYTLKMKKEKLLVEDSKGNQREIIL